MSGYRDGFNVGSRIDGRDTFCYESHPRLSPYGPAYWLFKFVPDEFVFRQKKVSKEKATRMPLDHSAHPCAEPFGCNACKSAILPICPVRRRFWRGFSEGLS